MTSCRGCATRLVALLSNNIVIIIGLGLVDDMKHLGVPNMHGQICTSYHMCNRWSKFSMKIVLTLIKILDFSLHRRTASSLMDQSCSMPHASPTPQEICILMKVKRGTSSACVPMELCSVCRWNIPTWAARHQTTHVEKPTERLDVNLLHLCRRNSPGVALIPLQLSWQILHCLFCLPNRNDITDHWHLAKDIYIPVNYFYCSADLPNL